MSYAVKTLPTGDTATTGTVIPPVLGAVDIWDGIWAAAPHHGQTTATLRNWGASSTMPSWPMSSTLTPNLSTGDPHITLTSGQWMVAQSTGLSGDYTFLIVLDVRAGSKDTVRCPGIMASNETGKWVLWNGSAAGNTGVAATGKAVYAFTRRGGVVEVWRNGVKGWSATYAALSDTNLGVWPRYTSAPDQDFYQARYAARALTDAQIVAASADARTLHGI